MTTGEGLGWFKVTGNKQLALRKRQRQSGEITSTDREIVQNKEHGSGCRGQHLGQRVKTKD